MRGIQGKQEYTQRGVIRDTRPLGTRVAETLSDRSWAAVMFGTAGLTLLFLPSAGLVADLALIVAWLYALWFERQGKRRKLPLRKPIHANSPDFADPAPGSGRPKMAGGIMYIGNDRETGEELWVTNDDARQHLSFAGTTGAGKSEGIKSLSANSLAWGSGFINVDGKAQTKLWAEFWSLVRRFGRDDDVRLLNYIKGNSDTAAVSNTLNPFAFGASGPLSELIVSLMADAGSDPMWKERAIGLVKAVVAILTWMRDNRGLMLDAGIIRSALSFTEVVKLSRRNDIDEEMRAPIVAYLKELPGFDPTAYDDEGQLIPQPPGKQSGGDPAEAGKQHNFLTMQLTRALGSLNDDFGYIFKVQLADIDLRDIVLNRRILIVLLPALEVSSEGLAALGKIVVALLKGLMASTMGSAVEGEWEETIDSLPTNSPSPSQGFFDEAGYYMVDGFDVMFAQARSIGYALNIGFQDVPALKKRVAEAADSVLGNANIQLWGRLTDGQTTRDYFEKAVGEVMVMEVAGYSAQVGNATVNYNDRLDAAPQRRQRAEWLDVRGQIEGQVHITFSDRLVRADMFYAAPKKTKAFRVPRLLQVGAKAPPPSSKALATEVKQLVDKLSDPTWAAVLVGEQKAPSAELEAMMGAFKGGIMSKMSPQRCGCVAIAALEGPLADKAARLRAALAQAQNGSAVEGGGVEVEPSEVPAVEEANGDLEPIDEVVDAGAVLDALPSEVPAPTPVPAKSAPFQHEPQAARTVSVAPAAVELPPDDDALAIETAEKIVAAMCLSVGLSGGTPTGGDLLPVPQPAGPFGDVPAEPSPSEESALFGSLAEDHAVHEQLVEIEIAAGTDAQQAEQQASSVMQSLEEGVHYPHPPTPEPANPERLVQLLEQIRNSVYAYDTSKGSR